MTEINIKEKKLYGFTIIELLVVIVVIGILTSIGVVSYGDIRNRAIITSLQSDLINASDQLVIDQARNSAGTFPTSLAQADGGAGVTSSPNTAYQYTVNNTNTPKTFCLTATNGSQNYFITQEGTPLPGPCPVLYLDAGISTSYSGTGTTWTDLSGNGNNGALMNGVTYSNNNGGVLVFDGTNDYINISNNLEWPGALTVVSWHNRTTKDLVNADTIVGNWYWNSLVANRRGWVQRYYLNSDTLLFIIDVTNGTLIQELQTSYITNINNWYQAVSVFDPLDRTVRLYINGVLRSTATAMAGYDQIAYDSSYLMQIGYNPVNGGYFTGQIGDVRIYNKAFSVADIKQDFDSFSDRYGL